MYSDQDFPTYRLRDVDDPEFSFSMHKYHPGDRVQSSDQPHRHEFYQIVYLTKGRGTHYIDFAPFPITPPILYTVAAGQVHHWEVIEPLYGYSLLFGPNVLGTSAAYGVPFSKLELFRRLSYAPLRLDNRQFELIRRIMDLVVYEYECHNNVSVLSSYLHILLTEIDRISPSAEPAIALGSTAEIAHRYRSLVSNRYLKHRSVDYYANELGITAAHLSRSIKEVTGLTAIQIIHQEVTMEARRLLTDSDLSVQMISDLLEFSDPAYFGRFFKRETGMSPGAFRALILKKLQAAA